jgi:hypothetical protein
MISLKTQKHFQSQFGIKIHCENEWEIQRKESTALERFYNVYKNSSTIDPYIKHQNGYASRLILKLRSGFSALYASILKYDGIPFENRLCPLCQTEPEDTKHFLLSCPNLQEARDFSNGIPALKRILNYDKSNQIDCSTLLTLYSLRNSLVHSLNL